MNKHYIDVIFAFLLAQALMTSLMVYDYQKQKNIGWWGSMKAYIAAEIGYFIIGLVGIISFCFILSDFIDLSLTKAELVSISERNWKQTLQLYFKTGAFGISLFIQYIAFKVRDKGKNAIDKAADKITLP